VFYDETKIMNDLIAGMLSPFFIFLKAANFAGNKGKTNS
jgi:hypothetical protein